MRHSAITIAMMATSVTTLRMLIIRPPSGFLGPLQDPEATSSMYISEFAPRRAINVLPSIIFLLS
jgi:hypothetical protein